MSGVVDRLFVDEKDRALYDRLESADIFEGKTRKEQFLFALAYALQRGVKRPVEKREGFFLAKDLHTEDRALLSAVAAYSDDSLDVLADKARVFRIAEEYAHAGIRMIVDEMESTQYGSFEKRLERDFYDRWKELALADD